MRKGKTVFKPKARIIKLLGEQLITDEIIALVELVKNSYDADAMKAVVNLQNVEDIEKGKISILDEGVGMSLGTVLDAWLQPGTEFKRKQRSRGGKSRIFGRPILGEKGVGRFAAQKLGSLITLITRDAASKLETLVEINWDYFEEDAFLSDVAVDWIQSEPKTFTGDKTGTLIEIRNITKPWNEDMVFKLAQKLQSLQSPFRERSNFQIELKCDRYPKITESVRFIDEFLKNAVYSLVGSISSKGLLTGKYKFFNPTFKNLARREPLENNDIKDPEYFKEDRKTPRCGEFDFRFYVWDLDHITLRETITRRTYMNMIKPHTGVRVYRDNFRVWSYGEEGNDWLSLDPRRVNDPPKCLSNNQLVGIIDISQKNNPGLVDKTDREGLILNEEFEDFKSLVLSALNELEIERRKDKTEVDRLRERKKGKKLDSTLDAIDELKVTLRNDGLQEKYDKHVTEIERAYVFEVKNVHEPLITSAGLGIAFQMPAHEIQIQLKGLKEILNNLEETMANLGLSGRITEGLSAARKIVSILDDISDGALELSRRKMITFSLESAIRFAEKIKKVEMSRAGVKLIYNVKENISVKGYQNYFITCVLNLIDNAIWWLHKIDGERTIRFTIKRDDLGNPIVIASDNGPGINETDIPYLGEAYFTRKLHGTGLGLFIVKRAMTVNRGKVEFGFHGDDPDFMSGANVVLTFESGGRQT